MRCRSILVTMAQMHSLFIFLQILSFKIILYLLFCEMVFLESYSPFIIVYVISDTSNILIPNLVISSRRENRMWQIEPIHTCAKLFVDYDCPRRSRGYPTFFNVKFLLVTTAASIFLVEIFT